jgi:hypothetical protein
VPHNVEQFGIEGGEAYATTPTHWCRYVRTSTNDQTTEISPQGYASLLAPTREGLEEAGYREGQNLTIEYLTLSSSLSPPATQAP